MLRLSVVTWLFVISVDAQIRNGGAHLKKNIRASISSSHVTRESIDQLPHTEGMLRKRGKKGRTKFFEYVASFSPDCSVPYDTWILRMNECVNIVEDNGEGNGTPISYVFEPTDDFFGLRFFLGHNCEGDTRATHALTPESTFGFTDDYVLGDCVRMGDVWFAKVAEAKKYPKIDYDAHIYGESASAASCLDQTYVVHGIERAGTCFFEEDEDTGALTWYIDNVSNCESGQIIRTLLASGSSCELSSGDVSMVLEKNDCTFDISKFLTGLTEEETGEFWYKYDWCLLGRN
mmetsp:Transcript_24684/g.36384  ORF Transcript_24684/g.36384 Transcript_24684/m.36384 type:complete len:290 (+) Transcript_24684:49-918(+)